MEVSGKIIAMSEDNLICLPCHIDGFTEPAFGYCQDCKEHLCETCFQHHRRPRPTRNHVLLDKENMPNELTENTMKYNDNTDFCLSHTDKRLEFYCTKHKAIACYVCITLGHKACEAEYIPDISRNILESEEFTSLMRELRALKEKCETRVKQIEVANEEIDQDHMAVIEDIKLFRKEINNRLDELEDETATEIELLKRKEKEKITHMKEVCKEIVQEVNEKEASLVILKNYEQLNKLFIEMKQSQEQLVRLKRKEANMQSDSVIHGGIKFVRNRMIIDNLNDATIGNVIYTEIEKTPGTEESSKTKRKETEHSNMPSEDKAADQNITELLSSRRQRRKNYGLSRKTYPSITGYFLKK